MTTHLWWYTSRASGIVAWALCWAAVVWVISLTGRFTRRPKPAWVLDLHRWFGALAVIFVVIHTASLALDNFVSFGLTDLFVPLASKWHPVAVAWGIIGFYLLLAIEGTSLIMKRLPRRFWHGVHLSSYVLYVVITIHLLAAGTDAGQPVLFWAAIGGSLAIAMLTIARLNATS